MDSAATPHPSGQRFRQWMFDSHEIRHFLGNSCQTENRDGEGSRYTPARRDRWAASSAWYLASLDQVIFGNAPDMDNRE